MSGVKRKADKDAAASNKSSKSKTPYELYFDQQKDFLNQEENKNILGAMLIKGMESDESSDEEGEENESKYTKEQMQALRFIMVTPNRDQELDKMRALVLQDQADPDFMTFSTSYSYQVLASWNLAKKRLSKLSNKAKKVDALMAYTHTVKQYDVWMHDNEGGMGELVSGLASAWKRLLKKHDDKELGWDVEYTKPGVLELLKQFKEQVESMDDCYDMGDFNYEWINTAVRMGWNTGQNVTERRNWGASVLPPVLATAINVHLRIHSISISLEQ